MKFSIIEQYTGKRGKIYSIQLKDEELSLYEKFVEEHKDTQTQKIRIIDQKLKNMVKQHGFIEEFFKRESEYPANVYKIAEKGSLRLFCIRYSGVAIIVGGGGIKEKGTIKLQENPNLLEKVDFLIEIEKRILERIENGEINITDKGFDGNLTFE